VADSSIGRAPAVGPPRRPVELASPTAVINFGIGPDRWRRWCD